MDSIVASRVPRRLCLCQYVTLPFPRGFISRAAVSKSLSIFNILVDCLDLRFLPLADQYINLFLDNANTGYAEVSMRDVILCSRRSWAWVHVDPFTNRTKCVCNHHYPMEAHIPFGVRIPRSLFEQLRSPAHSVRVSSVHSEFTPTLMIAAVRRDISIAYPRLLANCRCGRKSGFLRRGLASHSMTKWD